MALGLRPWLLAVHASLADPFLHGFIEHACSIFNITPPLYSFLVATLNSSGSGFLTRLKQGYNIIHSEAKFQNASFPLTFWYYHLVPTRYMQIFKASRSLVVTISLEMWTLKIILYHKILQFVHGKRQFIIICVMKASLHLKFGCRSYR